MALVTDDFRVYHALVPVFEGHGVHLLGLAPGEDVPPSVQVIVGGPAGDGRSVPLFDDAQACLLAAIAALDERPTAEDGYSEVVFGLDPGDAIGLAVVADGMALLVDQVFDPEAAVERLVIWKQALSATSWRAHIGDGAPAVGVRLEGLIHARIQGVLVRFVPEDETSPGSPATQSRHTDAAIHIALRRPPTQ